MIIPEGRYRESQLIIEGKNWGVYSSPDKAAQAGTHMIKQDPSIKSFTVVVDRPLIETRPVRVEETR